MIDKISTPLEEQETIINISPNQVSVTASVYSSLQSHINKLWKLHEQYPDDVKIIRDDKYGTEFEVPRKWIKVKPPRKVSEEQRLAAAERLARVRQR